MQAHEISINFEFNSLITKFRNVTKRFLQNRPISTNENKIREYIELLCITYNDIVTFIELNFDIVSENIKDKFSKKQKTCINLLKKSFAKLNSTIEIPEDGSLIPQTSFEYDIEFYDAKHDIELNGTYSKSYLDYIFLEQKLKPIHNMATPADKRNFITMCASIIRDNYNGNPLGLESFIDKVSLVEDLTEDNLKSTLVTFIISKLEGKARECLPDNTNSIAIIKSSLRERIKPDNSKVVAGRIASVQIQNNNYSEFTKQLEELADSFERSLVVEGMTHVKAHEMAVEQTVQVCRANAKSDLVKSILASSTFKDPKDVIAKLIIEQSNEKQEKQVLHVGNFNRYNSFNDNNRRQYNNNFRYNNNYKNTNSNNFRRNQNNYRNTNNVNQYRNNLQNNQGYNNQH